VLSILPTARVYAYVPPADMRKSFSGLVGIVEQELGQQVEAGGLFLFFNRRRNSVKLLFFTGDGLAIFYRRLERGTFELPRAAAEAHAGLRELEEAATAGERERAWRAWGGSSMDLLSGTLPPAASASTEGERGGAWLRKSTPTRNARSPSPEPEPRSRASFGKAARRTAMEAGQRRPAAA